MDSNNMENFTTQTVNNGNEEKPYSIGQWVGTLLLSFIPCVGLILMIVWAVSEKNKSKKNWAIASFIVAAIVFALYMAFFFAFGKAIVDAYSAILGSYMMY